MSNLEAKIDALLRLVTADTPVDREQARADICAILDTGTPPPER